MDIQHTVNSRPLTYCYSSEDGLDTITPNSFLRPYALSKVYLKDPESPISSLPKRSKLCKSIEIRDQMLEDFKQTWYTEYLISLRLLHKDILQTKFENRICEGDIVLIKNPAKKRQHWKLGKVVSLIPGNDGLVRAVKLVKGDEHWMENPPQLVIHSIKHLFPLELSVTHDMKERDLVVKESDLNVMDESANDMDIMEIAQDYEPNDLDDIGGEALN